MNTSKKWKNIEMRGIRKLITGALLATMMCGCSNVNECAIITEPTTQSSIETEYVEPTLDAIDTSTETTESIIGGTDIIVTEPSMTEPIETQLIKMIGIKIDSDNVKKKYGIAEMLDVSNLLVYVLYSNDTQIALNSDEYVITTPDTSTYGKKVVTVKQRVRHD